ncbi:MAG: C_GCAxxG_C_C family protein [Bacteroidales bacterium]|nr:C_GCAxxG_C_C family protein [Bacteroidales bacterium]
MDRAEHSVEVKHELGLNCCQAVLLEFAPEIAAVAKDEASEGSNNSNCSDMKALKERLLALGSGFGAGMGSMNGTCGALCGAAMVVGLLNKSEIPTTAITRELSNAFKAKVGALTCREIKGADTKQPLCSCDNCVRHAVLLTESVI